jgi:DNA (cytosine-5)-methyltransferase 1
MTLTVGSLFAGVGGFELGLEATGEFKTVWQVEIDEYAQKVLAKHWPDVRTHGDIRTFPTEPTDQWACDVICGGFPCQDISFAGKGAGLNGERSGLWYEYARVVRILRPRYVLVENVAALLTRGLDAVLGTLATLGYDAEWHCVPAAYVGAPHIRDRVWILAHAVRTEREPRAGRRGIRQGDTDAADAEHDGRSSGEVTGGPRSPISESSWWSTEPDVGRVAHGVPARVDRLRCLGNAVVPQVAQFIGRRLLEIHKEIEEQK